MKRFSLSTFVLVALPAALLLAGCDSDGGGPSAEERAAKMTQGMATHGASGPPAAAPKKP